MIDWTDAAIEAAIRGWFDTDAAFRPRMRAALNAAVQAQGFPLPPGFYCEPEMIQAIAKARADALEEAARVAWSHGDEVCVSKYDTASSAISANRMAVNIAADIRALKEKNG